MVGRVFWGVEGCNAGSMDTVARQFIEKGGRRRAKRSTNDQDQPSTVLFGSFSD